MIEKMKPEDEKALAYISEKIAQLFNIQAPNKIQMGVESITFGTTTYEEVAIRFKTDGLLESAKELYAKRLPRPVLVTDSLQKETVEWEKVQLLFVDETVGDPTEDYRYLVKTAHNKCVWYRYMKEVEKKEVLLAVPKESGFMPVPFKVLVKDEMGEQWHVGYKLIAINVNDANPFICRYEDDSESLVCFKFAKRALQE